MNTSSEMPGRMGRPLGFRRQQSIEAAMNLFWEKGIEPVSAKDLAGAMGIQRSSFYNSFGDKDRVFREALEQYAQIAPDRLLDTIQPGQPVMPQIRAFLKELCHVRASDPQSRGCMVCNGIAELASAGTPAGELLNDLLNQRIQHMQAIFKQAIRQKELGRKDPESLAHAFTAFLLGLNIISKVVQEEKALWKICQQYLQGLSAEPAK